MRTIFWSKLDVVILSRRKTCFCAVFHSRSLFTLFTCFYMVMGCIIIQEVRKRVSEEMMLDYTVQEEVSM